MGLRMSGMGRNGIAIFGALVLAQFTHNAVAAIPPSVTGTGVTVQVPAVGQAVTINLRELGAITGSAPLRVNYDAAEIFIDGRAGAAVGLVTARTDTNGPGFVCIRIQNLGNFIPNPEFTYQIRLSVSSLSTPTPTPPVLVGLTNQPGPVVDTPAEVAACNDPNTQPVADAGDNQSIADIGTPGESVVLDGSGSTDADTGTALTYQWTGPNMQFPPSQSPTLTTPVLQPGTYTFSLTVTDDSGDPATNTSEPSTVTITVAAPLAPTANAGVDQTLPDTDGAAGELVTLVGSGTDPDGTIELFEWFANDSSLGTGNTLETRLPDGVTVVELVVTDSSGQTASDTVTITIAAAMAPTASAGEDRSVADSDGQPGEVVALSGTATDPDGTIESYEWFLGEASLGTGATLSVRLPDGVNQVTLIATDNTGQTASDDVTVTIGAPAVPTANAGTNQTLADSDGQVGENVTLDGSASVATGGIASYVWQNAAGEQIAIGATPTVRLPDGQNVITLIVANNAGVTATDAVSISIGAAPQMPIANAGVDLTVVDTDRDPGEVVTLNASGSSDPNGQALTYQWSLQAEPVVQLGSGATLSVRLPDGVNTVMLRVEDPNGNFATDTVVVTIAAPAPRVALAELPNLTPNQHKMALALDRICVEFDELSDGEAALTPEQQALQERCDGLYFDNTAANQSSALEALGADDFAAARTQTLLFSNTLYAGVMDRLVALRGGARGLSLAGLNIVVDGKLVPLAQMQEMVKGLLGGGASSDADEAGGLFGDKLGVWARGNYSTGEKDTSPTSPSFEADQWALLGGLDYRLSDRAVIGASLAYGQSSIEFNPAGEGALDTTSWAASLYGSVYAAKNFYFDAIANVANSDYDAERNITYVDGTGLITADASGTTDGMTLSAGISGGYDFLIGGFTISPTLGFFYIDATIDGFSERGAAGLNLIYDEQNFASFTGNLGLRTTYAWNTSWGVLLPHVRIDYVREFEDDVDVFGVRFAGDPNANSTPPILVETDNPDKSYWRLATGFSAQFAHGFSGYVEYQRLESFEYISFEDLSIGLRMQKSF